MLCHFGDCTPREVSAMTGLNESTVRVHLFRAARKLRGLRAVGDTVGAEIGNMDVECQTHRAIGVRRRLAGSRAALLADRSVRVLTWFPRGTGAEAGVRTRAKPDIWSNPAGFRQAGATFVVAARALNVAARAGDVAQIRAAFTGVSHACSNCHDSFRGPAQQ